MLIISNYLIDFSSFPKLITNYSLQFKRITKTYKKE